MQLQPTSLMGMGEFDALVLALFKSMLPAEVFTSTLVRYSGKDPFTPLTFIDAR